MALGTIRVLLQVVHLVLTHHLLLLSAAFLAIVGDLVVVFRLTVLVIEGGVKRAG